MTAPVAIYTRNLELNDRLQEYVERKAGKLDRYIQGIREVRVDLGHDKSARSAQDRYVAEFTVYGKRFILRSEERADDIFTAIDTALDKIQRQIERYKGKRYRGRGDGTSVAEAFMAMAESGAEEEEEVEGRPRIVRRKRFLLTPMDELEAIEQMKLLGHDNFFVFYNANTNAINVIYKRRDGTYGLIEPELG